MPLSQQARAALVGLTAMVGSFVVFRGTAMTIQSDPLDAMPRGSFIVATIDVAALRQAPAYEALVGKDGGSRALGMGSLAEACGFDPLTRVTKAAVAVPEQGERGEFGLAAKISVSPEELEKCTKALGDRSGNPVETKKIGSYVIVEGPNGSRLAYGTNGLLLVGRGEWLDAMIATSEKRQPGAKDEPAHAALRRTMSARSPTVVITAVLPKGLRDRLKSDMQKEEDGDSSAITMMGVLGVATVGVAIEAGVPGGKTQLTAELTCDTPDACAAVDKLVVRQRTAWSRELFVRLGGMGPLVESIATAQAADHLTVTAGTDTDSLTSAFDRIGKMRNHAPPSSSALPQAGDARDPRNPPRLPGPYRRRPGEPDEKLDPKP